MDVYKYGYSLQHNNSQIQSINQRKRNKTMSTILSLPLHTKSTPSSILSAQCAILTCVANMPAMHLPENRQFGTIKYYDDEKGFGLITSDFGGELIVRRKSVTEGEEALKEGMKVSYEAVAGPRLLMAEEVQPEE